MNFEKTSKGRNSTTKVQICLLGKYGLFAWQTHYYALGGGGQISWLKNRRLKKSALSTSLIKVHSLPDVQRSNKSLSTLFYFSSPWSCRRFLAVCLIWCHPPGVKRRQLLSPANCYKTFRSLSFMQLASASMLPSQYELGSHNDVPISSGSWHVGAVYNLPSMAREPPAVHLIVPFLLNTFILSEVAALNN